MPIMCDLCGQAITPGQAFNRCTEPDYSPIELEVMGLGHIPHNAWTCDATSHTACIEALSAPRQCCVPVRYTEGLCFEHAGLGPGFLCLDCGRWHQRKCFTREVFWFAPGRIQHGICSDCERADRLQRAIHNISEIPLETLEAISEALRVTDVVEGKHIVQILGIIRDIQSVRVPHARQPEVSAEVAVRALQRVLATTRRLQSGLEREFFELLSRGGIEQEFRAQQAIPLDLASRDGSGRRAIVVTPDFTHRSLPYVLFLDGRAGHSTEMALVDDAEITTELFRRGFLVRRFRYHQLLSSAFQAQTLATVERDLAQLRSEALQNGFV